MKPNKPSKWMNKVCDHCGKKLNDDNDLIIYNTNTNGEVEEISFRHGSGQGCDDKGYKSSRHVKHDFSDILAEYEAYQKTRKPQ